MSRFALHLLLCLALACNGLAGGCGMAHAVSANADNAAEVAGGGHHHAHADAATSTAGEHQHGAAADSIGDCCNSAACTCGCVSAATGALASVMHLPHNKAVSPGLAAVPDVALIQTSAPFRPPTA